jgi:Sulfotransferase family
VEGRPHTRLHGRVARGWASAPSAVVVEAPREVAACTGDRVYPSPLPLPARYTPIPASRMRARWPRNPASSSPPDAVNGVMLTTNVLGTAAVYGRASHEGASTIPPMAVGLDADQLLETACERTGLRDFGDDAFRIGLDRLLDGLRTEARLNAVGEAITPENLLSYLVNRLQVTDWHDHHPEAAADDVAPIVFMIGMGRTGTTILHDLLGQDPANRVPRTWEVDLPVPPPETATYDTDPRIDQVQAVIDAGHVARPEIRAMHPTGARLAQECVRITGSAFASLIFLSQYRSPSYLRWLTAEADMLPVYAWHRRYLQLLQSHHRGDRWIVKSGAHLWALPALLAEYPTAYFIQTHRDPLRVIPSLSNLFATINSMFSDDVTVPEVAADWAHAILDALDRSVTAREDGSIPADRVVDVQFQALMDDPFGTIRTVYDGMGAELTSDAKARMRGFLADNARDKHGVHRYTLGDTGLDAGELLERSSRYREHFDVPSEAAR